MPVINIVLDATKVDTGLEEFKKAVQATSTVTGDFAVNLLKVNEAGKVVSGVIEQMNMNGTKMISTFNMVGGAAEQAGTKVISNAKAMADEMQRLAGISGQFAGDKARTMFPLPADASIGKIIQYNNAILNFQQIVGASGATAAQVQAMFAAMAKSPAQFAAGLQNLPQQLQAVGQAMLAVGNQAQQAGQQGAKAGQAILISWQGLVRIFEAQIFRRAISGIIDGFRSGVTAAIDYEIQLAQVGNVTGQTGEKLAGLGSKVRQLSDDFGVPIADVLTASQIALTGQLGNTADGFNVLTNAMRLSQATGTELAASTKLITSSLQAFRLSGDDAGRVTNVLYNAAQRSRVPLEEMQSAIGRVSQTAHGLGVSFEQTTALFLTIAQQGGRPTEAFSLLNQVMGRMLQPTRQLTDFFNQLGFSTPQLAISTLGLTQVLEKLSEAAARNPEALGDMSGSVRTLRGMMAVTGEQTKIFEENLRSLGKTNVLDGAANVAQTNAQKIRTSYNELKNVFTADFGREFLSGVVAISDQIGGAKASVAAFIEVLKGMISGFITLKGIGIVTDVVSYTRAINTAASATTGLSNAVGSASNAFGLFAVLFTIANTVGNLYFANQKANEVALEDAIRKRIKALNEVIEKQVEANNTQSRQRQEQIGRYAQEVYRPQVEASRRRLEQLQLERDRTVEMHKANESAFHSANQAILDGLREQLAQSRRLREEARKGIEESTKHADEFERSVRAQGVQETLGLNTDPRDKLRILDQEKARNAEEIRDLLNKQNLSKEDIEHLRRLQGEQAKITGEINQQDFALQRINNQNLGRFNLEMRNGRQVLVEYINVNAANARRNELTAENRRMEEQITEQLRRQQEEARVRQIGQQLQVRNMEAALRQVEQFNPFDAEGGLARRFTSGNRTNEQAQAAALAELRAKHLFALEQAKVQLGPQWNNINTEAGRIYAELERQQEAAYQLRGQEIQQATQITRERERQTDIGRQQVALANELNRIENERRTALEGLARARGTAGAAAIRAESTLPQLPLGNRPLFGIAAEEVASVRQFRTAYADLRTALVDLNKAQGDLDANRNPETVRQYTIAVERLGVRTEAVRDQFRTEAGRNAAGLVFNPTQVAAIRTFADTTQSAFAGASGDVRNFTARLQAAEASMTNMLRGSTGAAGTIATDLQLGMTSVINQAPELNRVFIDAAALAEALREEIERIGGAIEELPPIPAAGGGGGGADNNATGGYVRYRASGGIMGMHPGGPKGTDTIPAWLSPGEFVINKHSTDKFYSQLLAINSGHMPKYHAEGGPVNVGDINVSVNGGSTSDKTIREIGLGINRQIRQGRIRWRV